MKFGLLTEYKMRNIFLEKSYAKYDGETSCRSFSGKLKLSISLYQQFKIIQFVFIVLQVEGYQNILKLSYRPPCFYFILSIF